MSHTIHLNSHTFSHSIPSDLGALFELLGAAPDTQALFFSTPFEAYFHLYYAVYLDVMRQVGRNHILTHSLEPLVVGQCLKKVEPLGCFSKSVPLNAESQLLPHVLEEHIGPRTALLSLSWASSLTGVIQPIEEIAPLCKKKGILLHVDATHLFGKHLFRLQDLDIDVLTLTLSGGTLLLKKKQTPLHLTPFAAPLLSSFIEEAILHSDRFDHLCTEGARLRHLLEARILKEIPESCIHFCKAPRLPHCSAFAIPGVSGEALAFLLSRKGIYLSTGGNGNLKLSQQLLRVGVDPLLAHTSVSVAVSYETEESQIERFIETLVTLAKKLRSYSEGLREL